MASRNFRTTITINYYLINKFNRDSLFTYAINLYNFIDHYIFNIITLNKII
jgi:hypothetical protein